MPVKWKSFTKRSDLCSAVAAEICDIINNVMGSADKQSFSVAFSGGSLPSLVAEGLLALPSDQMQYQKWVVLYADERCAPHDHEDSNHKLVMDQLISKLSQKPKTILPIDSHLVGKPELAAEHYQRAIAPYLPSLDLILLGIGPDGHTCSLFPGHAVLQAQDSVTFIKDSPKPPSNRITLTLPVLRDAKYVIFVVTGSAKKEVVSEILNDPESKLPAALVVQQRKARNQPTVWYLDNEAAELLSE